jgi:hypothetical protein
MQGDKIDNQTENKSSESSHSTWLCISKDCPSVGQIIKQLETPSHSKIQWVWNS